MMQRQKQKYVYTVVLFLAVVLVLSVPSSAVSVSESPDVISRGGQVTVSIRDLKNDDTFSLLIEGRFAVAGGSEFLFATDNFRMPISLTKGELFAYTENTSETMLNVKKGNITVGVGKVTGPDGTFSYSDKRDIGSGTYEKMRLTGTVQPGKTSVLTRLQLSGAKSGPDDSEISFVVEGIDRGSIFLTVLVNDRQEMFREITLRPAGASAQAAPDQYLIPPTTPGTATPSTPKPAVPQTFSSVDQQASVTAVNIPYVGLIRGAARQVPPDWLAVSSAYTLSPDYLTFSPPAIIFFTVPAPSDPGTTYAYFIGRFDNAQWRTVPSTAAGAKVSGPIDRAGTYALMAFRPESTIPASTAPTAPATTPAVTMTFAETPKIASIAQAEPTAVPTKTPLSWFVVAGALATGAGLVIWSRRRN